MTFPKFEIAASLARLRGGVNDALALAGLVLIAAGVEMIYRPAAFIVSGALLLLFAIGGRK